MGNSTGEYRCWWGQLREKGHFEDLGVAGRKKLKWILHKWAGKA
jgi:hypothetical protein